MNSYEYQAGITKRKIQFDEKEVTSTINDRLWGSQIMQYRLDEISHQFEYDYIHLGFPKMIGILFLAFLFIILPGFQLIGLILLLVLVSLSISHSIFKKEFVRIRTAREPICIFIHSKKRKEALEFGEALIEASKNYLRRKYGFVDADVSPETQFTNYRWLYANHFIDIDAYEKLKAQLHQALDQKNAE